jgi:hypothetical protein
MPCASNLARAVVENTRRFGDDHWRSGGGLEGSQLCTIRTLFSFDLLANTVLSGLAECAVARETNLARSASHEAMMFSGAPEVEIPSRLARNAERAVSFWTGGPPNDPSALANLSAISAVSAYWSDVSRTQF